MAINTVFKFVNIRPPAVPTDLPELAIVVKATTVVGDLVDAIKSGDTANTRAEAEKIATTKGYAHQDDDLNLPWIRLGQLLNADSSKTAKQFKGKYDKQLQAFFDTEQKALTEDLEKLENTCIVDLFIHQIPGIRHRNIRNAIRAIHLIRAIKANPDTALDLVQFKNAPFALPNVVPPSAPTPLGNTADTVKPNIPADANTTTDTENKNEKAEKIERAIDELSAAWRTVSHENYVEDATTPIDFEKFDEELELAALIERDGTKSLAQLVNAKTTSDAAKMLFRDKLLGTTPAAGKPDSASSSEHRVLSDSIRTGLSPSTKNILAELKLNPEQWSAPVMVSKLESMLDMQYQSSANNTQGVMVVGKSLLKAGKGYNTFPKSYVLGHIDWSTSMSVLGVGDLLVVREELVRYEGGDLAHIENALRGELRERTHRRSHTIEESFTEETETNEENEKNLQTSDRFEMQNESQAHLSVSLSTNADVRVSASYGPTVGVESGAGFSLDSTAETSTSFSSAFAHEVTEQTVKRIQERVRQERTRKSVQEFEEFNRHTIDNTDKPNHMIGMYEYVNKVLCAQTWLYGKRLMLEFMIPQPAARLLQLAAEKAEAPLKNLQAPPEIDFGPQDLTRANYRQYVERFRVSGVTAYPPRFLSVPKSFTFEHAFAFVNLFDSVTAEIAVPEGYKAVKAYVVANFMRRRDIDILGFGVGAAKARVSISDKRRFFQNELPLTDTITRREITLDDVSGAVPVSITGWYMAPVSFTIEVQCEIATHGLQKWQLETYQHILQSHASMVAEYEEKRAALLAKLNSPAFSRNPLENRQIEQDELKRCAVQTMLAKVSETLTSNNYPDVVRFFESAFEWENMTYQLLPYYWASASDWALLGEIEDNDSIHQRFLKAGGARTVVPVRNEFAQQILGFLDSGLLAGGPLNQEQLTTIMDLMNQPEDLLNGIKIDEPWELVVPTSMVKLREDNSYPVFKDSCG